MKTYVWTIVILFGLESIAKIISLATGILPPRRKGTTAFDVVAGVGFIIWGVVLLQSA